MEHSEKCELWKEWKWYNHVHFIPEIYTSQAISFNAENLVLGMMALFFFFTTSTILYFFISFIRDTVILGQKRAIWEVYESNLFAKQCLEFHPRFSALHLHKENMLFWGDFYMNNFRNIVYHIMYFFHDVGLWDGFYYLISFDSGYFHTTLYYLISFKNISTIDTCYILP